MVECVASKRVEVSVAVGKTPLMLQQSTDPLLIFMPGKVALSKGGSMEPPKTGAGAGLILNLRGSLHHDLYSFPVRAPSSPPLPTPFLPPPSLPPPALPPTLSHIPFMPPAIPKCNHPPSLTWEGGGGGADCSPPSLAFGHSWLPKIARLRPHMPLRRRC